MTAQEILKLIETVSPDDAAKLDEIDEEVYFYVEQPKNEHQMRQGIVWQPFPKKYTRSRDELKRIRPEGWEFQADIRFACDVKPSGVLYRFWAMLPDWLRWNPMDNRWIHSIESPKLETEELAELHAIIQAIEYERGNK